MQPGRQKEILKSLEKINRFLLRTNRQKTVISFPTTDARRKWSDPFLRDASICRILLKELVKDSFHFVESKDLVHFDHWFFTASV